MVRKSLFLLTLILLFPRSAAAQDPRATLLDAAREMMAVMQREGFVQGLSGRLADSAVYLYEGGPLLKGRDQVLGFLRLQSSQGSLRWLPLIVALSQNGRFGVTSGAVIAMSSDAQPSPPPGHYITVWRRAADGPWRVIAMVTNGLPAADSVVLPESLGAGRPVAIGVAAQPMAEADSAFAAMARDRGAPVAFEYYAAPDLTTLPGPNGIIVGPAAMRARLASSPLGKADWRWHPVDGQASSDGDLGYTVGLSEISAAGETYYGKYLTVWRRQPDGELRFILDTGNDRPAVGSR